MSPFTVRQWLGRRKNMGCSSLPGPTSFAVSRESIQQRRQHVFTQVTLKLFHGSEVLLARRTSGLNNLVFSAHERIQIVALYFFSDRAQKFRLFHDF
jgi:hypothetical protein